MPGIVIQSNFDLMQSVPIDSRLVATNSTDRNSIQYKYAGLKVYQTDENRTYNWTGTNWAVESSGIYGGSGSLIGDTFIHLGTTSTALSSESYDLVYETDATSNTKGYFFNNFFRHTSTVPSVLGVEWRQQFKYFDGTSLSNSSFISFNPALGGTDVVRGGLAFSTGASNNVTEKMRITGGGNVGIGTNDPKEFLQIGSVSGAHKPLVFHNSGSAVIGYNWYFSGSADQFFDVSEGSSKIIQDNGAVTVQTRNAGNPATNFTSVLHVGPSGRVGVRTTSPSAVLDVNGTITSNSTITGVTVNATTVNATTVNASENSLAKVFELKLPTGATSGTYFSSNAIFPYQLTVQNQLMAFSTTSSNYFRNVGIAGNLDVGEFSPGVGGTISSYGNIVSTNGSITNFESSVNLSPVGVVLYNDTTSTTFNNGTLYNKSVALTQFQILSFRAYRVGALTHIDFHFRLNANLNLVGPFRGFVFKFSNSKFRPVDYGFGHAYAHTTVSVPMTESIPLSVDAFYTDTDYLSFIPLGVTIPVLPSSGPEFYIRVRTHNLGSGFGSALGSVINTTEIFKGSIVYKSGTI